MPPRPAVATPEPKKSAPLLPVCDEPELKTSRPLTPSDSNHATFGGCTFPNPGAPVPPLVPPAKKARFRILLYTGPYYKAFYVPATSIGRSARLFLVIQKENFEKNHFPYVKQGRENQLPF